MLYDVYKKVIQDFGAFETTHKIGFFKGSESQILNFLMEKDNSLKKENLIFKEVLDYRPEYIEDFSGLKPYIDLTK